MSNMISLTIDGVKVEVPQNTTVLKAAKLAGIDIPTLCYLEGINQIGSCRICVVDVGRNSLLAACTLPAAEGMVVSTKSKTADRRRETGKDNLELILSNHDKRVSFSCVQATRNCELQKLCERIGRRRHVPYEGEDSDYSKAA